MATDRLSVLRVDPRDPTPLYAQLEREIIAAIATGQLATGTQLPTVRQLAVELRINANTVARVYTQLERTGVLETRRGVGTFVVGRLPELDTNLDVRDRALGAAARGYLVAAAAAGASAADALAHLEAIIARGGESRSPKKEDDRG